MAVSEDAARVDHEFGPRVVVGLRLAPEAVRLTYDEDGAALLSAVLQGLAQRRQALREL